MSPLRALILGAVQRIDKRITILVLLLSILGVLFIMSATGVSGVDGESPHWLRQFRWLLLSALVLVGILAVPYQWVVEHAYLFYGLGIFSLIAVLFVGRTAHGSTRWFSLGVMDIQPSEFAKILMILTLARYIRFRRSQKTVRGLVGPFVLTTIPMGLILLQPDLGTALLMLPILFSMVYVAGARAMHLILIVVLGVGSMVPVYHFVLKDYQKRRIDVFLGDEIFGNESLESAQFLFSLIETGTFLFQIRVRLSELRFSPLNLCFVPSGVQSEQELPLLHAFPFIHGNLNNPPHRVGAYFNFC